MGSSYSAIELRPLLAEREGFEPPIPVRVCMISSHVHSTGLCHLSVENKNVRYHIALSASRRFFVWRFPIFSRIVKLCSACESVVSTDPTVLPARKVVLALACDPLDNHEIAFGVARFALHLFSQRCVRRWGRYCPRLHVARRRHFGASPLRQRSLFRRKIAHPSAYAGAWPGSEYLHSRPCTRLCGVCTIPPLSGSPAPRLMHLVRPRY